jgi:hypothetical protein
MENAIRAIEFYIVEYEKHTPNPSQEGSQVSYYNDSMVLNLSSPEKIKEKYEPL